MMKRNAGHNFEVEVHNGESGQAVILLVVALGVFLLASLAFAVDFSNMWFRRQATQTAADAACQAGSLDLLVIAAAGTPPAKGFTLGVAGDCSGSSAATMCFYANKNGYNGTGFSPTTAGNSVSWTFPATVPGATPLPTSVISNTFLTVTVKENVKTWFMSLLGTNYQQVSSKCTCGLGQVLSAPPLVVLSPTASGAVSLSGSSTVAIIGGPQRSLQVNSNSTTAVSVGGSSAIDLRLAGPASPATGGSIGVVGGPAIMPNNVNVGTTGKWQSPSPPLPDPYGTVPQPSQPAQCRTAGTNSKTNPLCSGATVSHFNDGCPDSGGCKEYFPSYYPAGISISGSTAIFMPGIYYLGQNLDGNSNSILRNGWLCTACVAASAPPSAADGVMFFFTGGAGLTFGANSGSKTSGIDPVPTSYLLCNNGQTLPSGIPASLNGNLLWAQCTTLGTYDNGSGSPSAKDTTGSRGLLMFVDRASTPVNLQAGGGGSMAFAGAFYFHKTTSFSNTFVLQGGSGSGTYVVGKIVTDKLQLGGNGSINMALSKDATTKLIKSTIFQ